MIEGIAMLTVLAGMGVYFVKSADLPKELKERSAQLKIENERNGFNNIRKSSFPKIVIEEKTSVNIKINEVNQRVQEQIRLKEIDELTLKITSLEQEIRANNLKNAEIQSQIDKHLNRLAELNNQKIS